MLKPLRRCLISFCIVFFAALPARAQLAVIDSPALTHLIQQVKTMQEQVKTAENQLSQARQALQTTVGDRGMELLLAGLQRNYLPTSWQQLIGAGIGTGGGFPGLGGAVQAAMAGNAVLTPQQLSTLSPAVQQQIIAGRHASALQQGLVQQALSTVSARFSSIQSLINSIATAGDQKGILDLQARINAELGMLQNEQTKLQVLQQAMQAQAAVNQQQQREQVVASHGNFSERFQPSPATYAGVK